MTLLVTGGRDYADRDATWRALDAIHRKHGVVLLFGVTKTLQQKQELGIAVKLRNCRLE